MQTVENLLERVFEKKPRVEGIFAKVNVESLTLFQIRELNYFFENIREVRDIQVKRSGAGLVVIVEAF